MKKAEKGQRSALEILKFSLISRGERKIPPKIILKDD